MSKIYSLCNRIFAYNVIIFRVLKVFVLLRWGARWRSRGVVGGLAGGGDARHGRVCGCERGRRPRPARRLPAPPQAPPPPRPPAIPRLPGPRTYGTHLLPYSYIFVSLGIILITASHNNVY